MQALTGVVPVRYPAQILVFNVFTSKFANMDILGDNLGEVYEQLDLKESPPFSSKFEGYGLESLNIIKNSGSIFFYSGVIPTLVFVRFIANSLALCFRRHERARKIGVIVFIPNKQELLVMALSKLVMETFTDLCLMMYL